MKSDAFCFVFRLVQHPIKKTPDIIRRFLTLCFILCRLIQIRQHRVEYRLVHRQQQNLP